MKLSASRMPTLAVLVVFAGVAAGCGAGDGGTTPTTGPPTTTVTTTSSSTTLPTSTVPPSTTPATTAPTSTLPVTTTLPPPTFDAPSLLVAHGGGIDIWTPYGSTQVLAGVPVAVAMPDLMGGIVYEQLSEAPGPWVWDTTLGRARLDWSLGGTPTPIMWMAGPDEDPVVLVGEEDRTVTPVQVALVDDRQTLLYRAWVGEPITWDCDPQECAWDSMTEYLIARDLASGVEVTLGTIGGFESSMVAVRLGGDLALIETELYGGEGPYIGVVPLDEVMTADAPRWIGSLCDECSLGPATECPQGAVCHGSMAAALSPDGSRLGYVIRLEREEGAGTAADPVRNVASPVEFVVYDPVMERELSRTVVGDPDMAPTWVDFDGVYAVIGLWWPEMAGADPEQTAPPVLVRADGAVYGLPFSGVVRMWNTGG